MKFSIISLFPEMFELFFKTSIVGRGVSKSIFDYEVVNLRDYAINEYGQVDDVPFGGGAGMLLRPEPLFDAFEALALPSENKRVISFSPKGRKIDHEYIINLTKFDNIVLICGHYEGIDERFCEKAIDELVSIGDFVVTGGELPAMLLVDAVVRQLKGVIKQASLEDESFTHGLLEHRQYTRPSEYRGLKVPGVLLSGHHKNIEEYKLIDAVRETVKYRPDLAIQLLETLDDTNELYRIIKRELQNVSN